MNSRMNDDKKKFKIVNKFPAFIRLGSAKQNGSNFNEKSM